MALFAASGSGSRWRWRTSQPPGYQPLRPTAAAPANASASARVYSGWMASPSRVVDTNRLSKWAPFRTLATSVNHASRRAGSNSVVNAASDSGIGSFHGRAVVPPDYVPQLITSVDSLIDTPRRAPPNAIVSPGNVATLILTMGMQPHIAKGHRACHQVQCLPPLRVAGGGVRSASGPQP